MEDYIKIEARKITNRIGSPYGEGATYARKHENGPSHLDDVDADEMIEDIVSLVTEVRKKWLEEEIGKLKQAKQYYADRYSTDTTFECEDKQCAIQDQISRLEAELKALYK